MLDELQYINSAGTGGFIAYMFLKYVLPFLKGKNGDGRKDKALELVQKACDDKHNKLDGEISKMVDKIVWRDTCVATHKGIDDKLKSMDNKLDILLGK